MKRNMVVGGVVVAACVVVAIAALGNGSLIQSRPFASVRASSDSCALYGKLDRNSIQSLQGGNKVRFVLAEEKKTADGKAIPTGETITVYYNNPVIALTANFPAASHAKAQGYFDAQRNEFVAHSLVTKCPSKYEADMDLATQESIKKWQKDSGLKPPPGSEVQSSSSRIQPQGLRF